MKRRMTNGDVVVRVANTVALMAVTVLLIVAYSVGGAR